MSLRCHRGQRLLISVWLGLAFPTGSMAQAIVVPNSLANVEGNSNNSYPFNISNVGLPSQHYQQVFSASQFAAIGGPISITQILFRADSVFGAAFSSTLPSIRIDMSTTAQSPDGLLLSFAGNLGADNTTVYGGTTGAPLNLSSAAGGGPPHTFDITINLTTPFVYSPFAGNLLLDVRNFGAGFTTVIDAHNVIGDSISRIATEGSGVNSATADFADSGGLVTQFVFVGVPEPSAMVLVGASISGFAGWRLRRRVNIRPIG